MKRKYISVEAGIEKLISGWPVKPSYNVRRRNGFGGYSYYLSWRINGGVAKALEETRRYNDYDGAQPARSVRNDAAISGVMAAGLYRHQYGVAADDLP